MKSIPALLLLPALYAACLAPGLAQEAWKPFRPETPVSFSVLLPSQPHRMGKHDEWRCQDSQGRLYTMAFGYYTEPRITDPKAFMRMMVKRLSANTNSKVAYTWFFKSQGAPACEFKLVDLKGGQVDVGRYFLVHQWFYFLDVASSDRGFDQASTKKFLDSFRMVNPALESLHPGSSGEKTTGPDPARMPDPKPTANAYDGEEQGF